MEKFRSDLLIRLEATRRLPIGPSLVGYDTFSYRLGEERKGGRTQAGPGSLFGSAQEGLQ